MIKTKKILSLATIIFFTMSLLVKASDENLIIEKISKINENQIIVSFDKKIGKNIEGEVKLFKDLKITDIEQSDLNKVTLNLINELEIGKIYNVFPIHGISGNADFEVKEDNTIEIIGETKKGIEKIKIISPKTLEITFKENIMSKEFIDFKLLENIDVLKIEDYIGKLKINLGDKIQEKNSYILMILSLKDSNVAEYKTESVYNFESDNLTTEKIVEKVVEESEEKSLELNSAGVEDSSAGSIKASTGNIKEVADNAKGTPETGPETYIMLVLALIISSFFLMTRKTS